METRHIVYLVFANWAAISMVVVDQTFSVNPQSVESAQAYLALVWGFQLFMFGFVYVSEKISAARARK